MKYVFAFLAALLAFTACDDKETVSGEMTYRKGYELTAFSSFTSTGSDCAALLTTVQQGINTRIKIYNKEWKVRFSGSSEDSALSKADQEAVADFDAAVESLLGWRKEFEDFKATRNFGKGSFSITYIVRVWRNKVLKESEPIVFEYEYRQ